MSATCGGMTVMHDRLASCCLTPSCCTNITQAKGKELLALTDKLHACEAEAGQLRKQASTLQSQLESAQAKMSQQTAALTSAHEAHTTLQVGPESTAQVFKTLLSTSLSALHLWSVQCPCSCTRHYSTHPMASMQHALLNIIHQLAL